MFHEPLDDMVHHKNPINQDEYQFALFYGNALRQVSRLIHIQALRHRQIVGKQLQRYDGHTSGKIVVGLGNVNREVSRILNVVVSVSGQSREIASPGRDLRHVDEGLRIEVRVGQDADHKGSVFNQADGAVL